MQTQSLLEHQHARAASCGNQCCKKTKLLKDNVHGTIELHELCAAIVDTQCFQRLRDLKQLGCVYSVFPSASHNRFEHSLGVSYLAGKFAKHLQERQPELQITDKEVVCCQVAGLCHDLGHGVLSHAFDDFVNSMCQQPDTSSTSPAPAPDLLVSHEQRSLALLDHIISTSVSVQNMMRHYDINAEDIVFIKDLIMGDTHTDSETDLETEDETTDQTAQTVQSVQSAGQACRAHPYRFTGRRNKEFLFQIVANKDTGIDVDKFDYLARDALMTGVGSTFDALRLICCSSVLWYGSKLQICFHEKEAWNIYEMFHTRYSLHKRVYKHRVSSVVTRMMVDALVEADKAGFAPLVDAGNKPTRISEAISKVAAFAGLSDSVLWELQRSTHPKFAAARDLLMRVSNRLLYVFIGEEVVLETSPKALFLKNLEATLLKECCLITPSDVFIDVVQIDYGMKDRNPVDKVGFFGRASKGVVSAKCLQKQTISCLAPQVYMEAYVRLYIKDMDPAKIKQAKDFWASFID